MFSMSERKLIEGDDENDIWVLKKDDREGDTLHHICHGKEEGDEMRLLINGKKAKPMAGIWPIRKGKCSVCEKEVPNHVMIHIY